MSEECSGTMFDLLHAVVSAFTLFVFYKFIFRNRELDHIPTVGFSAPFLSSFSAIKFIFRGQTTVEEGYRKYPNQVWKLPMLDEWLVVANGVRNTEDIRKAREEQLSGIRSNAVFYQWDYTIGPEVTLNPYHINIIRGTVTRNIAAVFDVQRDEMLLAIDGLIPRRGDGWVEFPVFEGLVELIFRISFRAFVGLPLCRNVMFRRICIQGAVELVKGRLLYLLPSILRRFAGRFITNMEGILLEVEKHLEPILEHRLEEERLYGADWPDKPNDIITLVLEGAKATREERTVRNLAKRILLLSFASTHTSANAVSQTLYQLCAHPEYIKPLQEEIHDVINNEGWSKTSVGKLHKLDSFLRETQRYNGLGLVLLNRRVLKDFTFSDGTFVPAGTSLCVNSWGTHRDETIYPSAHAFDGFRFLRADPAEQLLMATPTLEYVAFGHGRPACPGRFFAAVEIKMILAHIIDTYDFKLKDGVVPRVRWLESKIFPDLSIRMVFKKRC